MKITLNGEARTLKEALTIEGLVYELGLEGEKIAVECNLALVPRAVWETHAIKAGDKIEIINFVGGGK